MTYFIHQQKISADNKSVYRYWKEKCGLVTKGYAKKMLGVGDRKFDKIKEKFNLIPEEHPAPSGWKTKLYRIKDIKDIIDEICEENG